MAGVMATLDIAIVQAVGTEVLAVILGAAMVATMASALIQTVAVAVKVGQVIPAGLLYVLKDAVMEVAHIPIVVIAAMDGGALRATYLCA